MKLQRIPVERCFFLRGYGWIFLMPPGIPAGDDPALPQRSTVRLFEDGRELGPGHTSRLEVCDLGGGRYFHGGRRLFFSASDNSDPRRNGRRYEIAVAADLPVETGPVADAATYAIEHCENTEALWSSWGIDGSGKVVLEIGPGHDLGAQLLLADRCARFIAAGPALVPWSDGRERLYRLIQAGCGRPAPALLRALAQRSVSSVLTLLSQPAEALTGISDREVDIVLSNAVLEHVTDLEPVWSELRRLSRPGAWHFHQVDLRDHDRFTRPLEHLLLPQADFERRRQETRNGCGCQWRPSQLAAAAIRAGFTLVKAVPFPADPAYLADWLPRLRACASAYAGWPEEDAGAIGLWLVLRVPDQDRRNEPT